MSARQGAKLRGPENQVLDGGGPDPQMGMGAFPVTRIWIWSKYLVEGCIPIVNYRDYANICTQWQCSLLPNQYGQLLVIKSECEIRLQAFVIINQ